MLAKDEPVYGLTTGVGERKSFLLDRQSDGVQHAWC